MAGFGKYSKGMEVLSVKTERTSSVTQNISFSFLAEMENSNKSSDDRVDNQRCSH